MPVVANEEAAVVLFQALDVLAHCGLGQIQMFCSASEIPKFGQHCKGSEPLRINHHEVLS